MIIWISSYPKSGNTWVRSLIATYLYSKKGEFNFSLLNKIPKFTQDKYFSPLVNLSQLKEDSLKISQYWLPAQLRINLNNEVNFFKTHNACVSYKNKWFTDEKNTVGYIYIVRDPRAVACSNASHLNYTLDESVNDLLDENLIGYNGNNKLAEISSSWKINYLSWKKKKKYNGIIIKYEDLIDNTENEFKKILTFLKNSFQNYGYTEPSIPNNEEKILKSINSCKFSKLREMEDIHGFSESTNNKFFRVGTKDSWKKELSAKLKTKIEESFKEEMLELGYL